jgi:hypothetical protein
MVSYDLSHLTQSPDQRVQGPIQDDEALLLYALVKVMRLRRDDGRIDIEKCRSGTINFLNATWR